MTLGDVRRFQAQAASRREVLAWNLVLNYLYVLEEDHRKLQSMVDLVELLRRHRIDVLPYVMPVDVQTGAVMVPGFRQRLTRNIEVIDSLLQRRNTELLDLATLIPATDFSFRSVEPNEHLRERGRRRVANQLADHIDLAW